MPAVKRIVEGVSGVPANAQRLLCRGRVLADEASMESARVEDGDTLLLVTRAPETEANPNLARDPHAPENAEARGNGRGCLLYTSPSPRDRTRSRMPSSA